jgi:hypothetical protein
VSPSFTRSRPVVLACGVVALAALAAACSDSRDSPDAGALDSGVVVTAPTPPASPVLTPCPAGWREVQVGTDPTTCEPWPETGRATCAGDEAHFAGEPGCRPVSRACPADGWPEALPAPGAGGTTRYVRASAAAGGDGSLAAPLRTIGAALAVATAGDVIAVGEGAYDEIVVVATSVTLVGACAGGSVLAGTVAPSGRGRLDIDAMNVVVRDLGVHGRGLGVWVSRGASATLEGVVVRDVDLGGLVVLGTAQLRDVLVRDVGPGDGGAFGRGIHAEGGARVDATRLVVERARELGVSLAGGGTSARLEDLVVDETLGLASDGTLGLGITVYGGAQVELARAVVERNRFMGVNAGQMGTSITATDLVVRDTEGQAPSGNGGEGLYVGGGASLQVQRGLFERDRGMEAASYSGASFLRLEDCVLRDTRVRASDGAMGGGLAATEGGSVTLRRVAIARVAAVGVIGDGAGAQVDAEDLTITDVSAQGDGTNGSGVVADRGATLLLTRASLERLHLVGIFAGEATSSSLVDVSVRGVESQPVDGYFGFGVEVASTGSLQAQRLEIADTRGVGLSAYDEATLTATDVSVVRTRAMACADGACVGAAGGVGALARAGDLLLSRFVVADAALCGVQVAVGGALDLSDGEIARSGIGASVLVDGYDLGRLTSGVVFRDNARNIDATVLPVPEPAIPQLLP